MSGPSTFSYAQAIKGRTATPTTIQPATQATSSPAAPSSSSLSRDDASSANTPAVNFAPTCQSTASEISESVNSVQTDPEASGIKGNTDIPSTAESIASTAPSADDDSTDTVRPKESSVKDTQSAPSERAVQSSSRPGEGADGRKGRKGKKGKGPEKDTDSEQARRQEMEKELAEKAARVELFEAPPPAVNIWHQRAALAKTSQPSTSSVSSQPAGQSSTKSPSEESTKKENSKEGADAASLGATKDHKKPVDGARLSNDQASRRPTRGSRVSERDEKSVNGHPSPPQDASSWPTPESAAVEEDKRKIPTESERASREKSEDSASAKPRPKEKYKKLDFIPTVKFETELQPRSANRTRGGGPAGRNTTGRGGHAAAASISGEKTSVNPGSHATKAADDSQDKSRDDAPVRGNTLPTEKSKRFTTDARKQPAPATANRGSGTPVDGSLPAKSESSRAQRNDAAQGVNGQPMPHFPEQRNREGASSMPREARGPRRGNGGPARGGAHAHNGIHAQPVYMVNGHGTRSVGLQSPPPFSNGYPSGYAPPSQQRPGRGRPQSMSAVNGGYRGPANVNGRMPMQPIQTEFNSAPYPYGPYSAFPGVYPPHYDANQPPITEILRQQVEYYFSIENLERDLFMLRNMDSQGFVPFDLIAGFKRMRQLTADTNLIRTVCEASNEIDFVVGDDHKERIRRRAGWNEYVMWPVDKRFEQAQNEGPAQFRLLSKHSQPINGDFQQPQVMHPAYPAVSPQQYGSPFPPDMSQVYPYYSNSGSFYSEVNGVPVNGQIQPDDSQLNASVPEFSPGGAVAREPSLQTATTVTDDDIARLYIVVDANAQDSTSSLSNGTTGHAASSVDNLAQDETNGVHPGADVTATPEAGPRQADASANGTFSPPYWRASDDTETLASQQNIQEPYTRVRSRALEQRRAAQPGDVPKDMVRLYKFWGHYLLGGFNPTMYEEFRTFATADAESEVPSKVGLNMLLKYYQDVLDNTQKGKLWPSGHQIYGILDSHYQAAKSSAVLQASNGHGQAHV